MKIKIFSLIIVLLLFLNKGYSIVDNKTADIAADNGYKIIFWPREVTSIEELQETKFEKLFSKYKPSKVVSDKDIVNYYWDEQLIEIKADCIMANNGPSNIVVEGDLFTVILNNSIIFHGLNRDLLHVEPLKYDDSNYPAIIFAWCKNPEHILLALKPYYGSNWDIFRDYDEEEQKSLLFPEVLKHFEEQGKIIRGKIDLKTVFKRYWGFELDKVSK